VKRTSNKRLTLELERVRTLVVELSPEELRRVGGGLTSNTTTQEEEEAFVATERARV
jgi:hypothetical protein